MSEKKELKPEELDAVTGGATFTEKDRFGNLIKHNCSHPYVSDGTLQSCIEWSRACQYGDEPDMSCFKCGNYSSQRLPN